MLIPEEAVLAEGDSTYVFTVAGRRAPRAARCGSASATAGTVEVLDGLAAGETVVRAGLQRLRDGAEVQVRRAGRRRPVERGPERMISDFCIKRPVFAAVLSLLIIVLGVASLLRLPVRELPDVDAAVVCVTTAYTGAAPEIVDTDITELIEGAVAGIAGVKTITSTSQRGRGRTTIEFEPDRNIDEAANDVRDAVARVRGELPDEVDEPQITKSDSDSDPVMRIAITSDRMSPAEITDYVERFIVDRLATLDGVAQVEIFGERRFAIRIWLDRRAMAARNLTVDDIEAALRRNNVELPAGELESTIAPVHRARREPALAASSEFESIVIERIDGYPIRLADVARVERGVEDDDTIVRSDGARGGRARRAAPVAGQHDRDLQSRCASQLELIRPTLPEGMEIDDRLRRRGLHQPVDPRGAARARHRGACWWCW